MDRRTPASPPRALTAARLWRALAGRPEGPGRRGRWLPLRPDR